MRAWVGVWYKVFQQKCLFSSFIGSETSLCPWLSVCQLVGLSIIISVKIKKKAESFTIEALVLLSLSSWQHIDVIGRQKVFGQCNYSRRPYNFKVLTSITSRGMSKIGEKIKECPVPIYLILYSTERRHLGAMSLLPLQSVHLQSLMLFLYPDDYLPMKIRIYVFLIRFLINWSNDQTVYLQNGILTGNLAINLTHHQIDK